MVAGPAWWERAACSGAPLEIFFEDYRSRGKSRAAALCASCPVTKECLQDALRTESQQYAGPWGFRAGRSASQRRSYGALRRSA